MSVYNRGQQKGIFMWRAIPLAKMVLRMVVFGALLGASLGLVTVIAFQSTIPAPKSHYHPQIIVGAVEDGVLLAGLAGIAMALYAGIVHRYVHKPAHFRFALLIVATIVSLAVVQYPFHIMTLSEFGIPLIDGVLWALREGNSAMIALFAATIVKHTAIGWMSLYAASRYLRDASESFSKSRAPTLA